VKCRVSTNSTGLLDLRVYCAAVCRDMSVTKVNEFNAPHVGEEHSPSPSCFDQISDSPGLLNNGYRGHYDGGWPAYNDKWMVTTLTAMNGAVMKCTVYRSRKRSLPDDDSWSGKQRRSLKG